MDQQEMTELISATATLMEQFERNCTQIELQQRAFSQQLQTLSLQLPATVRQSADATLSHLPGALNCMDHHALRGVYPGCGRPKRIQ